MGVSGVQVMSPGAAPRDEDSSPSLPSPSAAPQLPSPSSSSTTSPGFARRCRPLSLLTVAVVVLACLAPSTTAAPRVTQCPSANEMYPCTCRVMRKGLDIVCDHVDENQVRNALEALKKKPVTIFWMKFRNCKLPRIPDYVFLGLDVRHLNIIRSNVSEVERNSLSALGSTLETLDLANNDIKEVPTKAFANLEKLKFLNLNYNKIQVLSEGAFSGLINLERLTLYENLIQHIHQDAFKDHGRKLLRLNLGRNQLEDIPTDTFHPLVNLEVLDLHENRIKSIPDGAFQGLRKLDMLKLEHNFITSIQDNVFSDLTVLNSLNIEHNHIEDISDGAFAGLEGNLEWLEIGNNRLDHIPSDALHTLQHLRQLDLDTNNITYVQEDAFRGYGDTIKYILLGKNRIKAIASAAFEDLHSLEWLNLSQNELQELTAETVQPILDTLTMIDVSKNPLICGCDLMWLITWISNPIHRDGFGDSEETMCLTRDAKAHIIKDLSANDFTCNTRNPTLQVPSSESSVIGWSPLLTAAAVAITLLTAAAAAITLR